MESKEAAEVLTQMLENQKATDEKFTQVLEGFQASKKETAFVDVAMKVGIALTVAGIMYVIATLPAMQVKMTEISVTQAAMKELVIDLKDKTETAALRSREGFITQIQPYDLRINRLEERARESKGMLDEISKTQAQHTYALESMRSK